MQKVVYESGKRVFLPAGWQLLKVGTVIRETDRYLDYDTGMWRPMLASDPGTRVYDDSDVIIRKSEDASSEDIEPDGNKVCSIPDALLSSSIRLKADAE